MGCRGTAASRGLAAPLSAEPGAAIPPPFPLTVVSSELFLSHILTLLFSGYNYICRIMSFFLLDKLSRRLYHHFWRPAAHLSRSWLALALLFTVEASSSFLQKATPYNPVATKAWPYKLSVGAFRVHEAFPWNKSSYFWSVQFRRSSSITVLHSGDILQVGSAQRIKLRSWLASWETSHTPD